MSRISSSSASGVRVAAQPLSNIYTILLVIGLLALILALVMLWITLEQRYGAVWAVTDPGKNNLNAPANAAAKQKTDNEELDSVQNAISSWKLKGPVKIEPIPVAPATPEGGAAPTAPATEGGATPAAPEAPAAGS